MSNYCHIENTQKLNLTQLLGLGASFLLELGCLADGEVDAAEQMVLLRVKNDGEDLILPIWLDGQQIVFYDTPSAAFFRTHDRTHPYLNHFHTRWGVVPEELLIYSFLHEHLKHRLAVYSNTVLDSDGAGSYVPNTPPEKYATYEGWWKHFSAYYQQKSFWQRLLLANLKKVYRRERAYLLIK